MNRYYILKDKKVIPVNDVLEWAKMFEKKDRRVAEDNIGEVRISTVFLGLDHRIGKGKPLIFETMIFEGELDQEMDRYSTYEEAEKGHKFMVKRVKEKNKMKQLKRISWMGKDYTKSSAKTIAYKLNKEDGNGVWRIEPSIYEKDRFQVVRYE